MEGPVILVVDDDAMLRLLAVEALEGAGFDVVEAETGEEGLARFQERTPDLVLLDLLMPKMDGYTFCEKVRSHALGASIPIMVMTGLHDTPSIDRAYEAGATDFVTKPINYGLLAHRLRYMLRAATAFRDARASTRRLGRAQQLARLAQWELDLRTKQFRWSEETNAIFPMPAANRCALGAWLELVHDEDRGRVESAFHEAVAHDIEYRIVLPGGDERIVQQHADIVDDVETGDRLLSAAAQDVTELRAAERKVKDLAYFDTLTGLPNRALLGTFLTHALTMARRDGTVLALLSLDLDGFKRVNDSLGHAAGDALLGEVASRISGCIRLTDGLARNDAGSGISIRPNSIERQLGANSIASRFGGDEFVVVLANLTHADNAALVARRIADRLAQPFTIGGTDVFISASIGIACFPDAGHDAEVLLSRADAAMYHAKQSGRNQYQVFTAGIDDKVRRRLELENALRLGLARSGIHPRVPNAKPDAACEFRLEYQPKVEVPTGEVMGAEALLRWTSPELGPISPLDFIGIAEDTGLIVQLGEWVLRTACQQAKRWDAEAHGGLRIAVNVSTRQFRDPAFPATVSAILAETGLAPSKLELEITEGMLMHDTIAGSKVLAELKRVGVRIALDDFGTGYSSLSYLTKLPIDVVKIDRSFVQNIDGEGKAATITAAIIGLSRGLDIEVVVEGVETQDQLDFISLHGRTEIQGYLFARPMSEQKLKQWRDDREAGMGPLPSRRPRAA